MIIVFTEPSMDSLLSSLNIATYHFHEVNEDLEYCLRRERAMEILACRDLGVPYVVLDESAGHETTEHETAILDCNIDVNLLPEKFTIVPRWRSTVPLPPPLRSGSLLVSPEQDQAIAHWPLTISEPDRFLKRNVFEVTQAQFNDMMDSGRIQPPLFIKGVSKGSSSFSLHHVFRNESELNSMIMTYGQAKTYDKQVSIAADGAKDSDFVAFQAGQPWFCPYREMELLTKPKIFNPKTGIILSDVLEISRIDNKRLEFRAFIVKGEVTSLSAYVDYQSIAVPREISEIAHQFAVSNAHLAPAFVADFGMTDRGAALIEMNEFALSGRYLDNDPILLYKALTRDTPLYHYTFIDPKPVPEDKEPDFMTRFLDHLDDEQIDVGP